MNEWQTYNKACYIPVGHVSADLYSDAPSQLPMAEVLARLKPLLEDPAGLLRDSAAS